MEMGPQAMAQAWYGSWLFWTAVGGGVVAVSAAGGIAVWLRATAVQRHLLRTLREVSDRLMRDVLLPDGVGGFVPVDALLLRDNLLYVLDIYDLEGAIFGADKMDVWTAMGRHRYQFKNPLRPMHDQVAAVKLVSPELAIQTRILFTSRGHFPKGRPDGVQLLEEFAQPLLRSTRKPKGPVPIKAETEIGWEKLCDAANVPPGRETPDPVK